MKIQDKKINEFVEKLDDLFKEYRDQMNVPQMMYCAIQTVASITMSASNNSIDAALQLHSCLTESLQLMINENRKEPK